jgi:hypothetical protein
VDLIERAVSWCRQHELEFATLSKPMVTVEFTKPSEFYDRPRLDWAEHVLRRDRVKLRREPHRRAHLHAVAAVNAARIGRWTVARGHAWRAVRAQPLAPQTWARLAVVSIRPLARRRWLNGDDRPRLIETTGP